MKIGKKRFNPQKLNQRRHPVSVKLADTSFEQATWTTDYQVIIAAVSLYSRSRHRVYCRTGYDSWITMLNYHLKREIIQVCLDEIHVCSLLDNQQFDKDDLEAAALGITSSTWSLFGIVWPASQVLAAEVSVANLAGKRVLEIGCGIGLASIVLHKMGVDITASDYHPRAQEFLDRNVLDNKLLPIKFQTVDFEKKNLELGKFDLIIASDILYQPHHAKCVANFISNHSDNNVEVIVVDPGRENRSKFTLNMTALGYSNEFKRFNQALGAGIRCKGQILHYHRQSSPVRDEFDTLKINPASITKVLIGSMTKMQDINNIKIVGIDIERPPKIRKEAYIDLFFKLSEKAPLDWCEDFNTLSMRMNPTFKIAKNDGICVEAWVRDMNDIAPQLKKIQQKILDCNELYIEKARQKQLAMLAANTDTSSANSKQLKLNEIVADLEF